MANNCEFSTVNETAVTDTVYSKFRTGFTGFGVYFEKKHDSDEKFSSDNNLSPHHFQ